MMRPTYVLALLCLLLARAAAQPTCETLLSSFQQAIDEADAYRATTRVMQGDKELYYLLSESRRDENGDWLLETLEERSSLPFGGGGFGGEREEDDEDPAETCRDAVVTLQGAEGAEVWQLDIPQDEDSPVTEWGMTFVAYRGAFVPDTMRGRFDVRVLLVPFRGTFTTSFHDWVFPLEYTSPGER